MQNRHPQYTTCALNEHNWMRDTCTALVRLLASMHHTGSRTYVTALLCDFHLGAAGKQPCQIWDISYINMDKQHLP